MMRLAVLSAAIIVLNEACRFALTARFKDAKCDDQPILVQVDHVPNCTSPKCTDSSWVTWTSDLSYNDDIASLFDSIPYILCNENNCSEFQSAQAINLTTGCVKHETTGRLAMTKQKKTMNRYHWGKLRRTLTKTERKKQKKYISSATLLFVASVADENGYISNHS
ncbi:hypothetical protein PHMEG_00037500 [Phytophthora megakarya]|uniref:Secreted protein n=1 Tax=Phytophthora megakarya TaxID=4795 RepID=A0A225UJU2_9STRA|nr:hypothetical protein PHMEG_00037500 [Phytophthora megakarya]